MWVTIPLLTEKQMPLPPKKKKNYMYILKYNSSINEWNAKVNIIDQVCVYSGFLKTS